MKNTTINEERIKCGNKNTTYNISFGNLKTDNMNLQLSLKTKWFDLTKAGVKLEDYRELTPYWEKRLLLNIRDIDYSLSKEQIDAICENFYKKCNNPIFKNFTTTTLTLGYPKSTDTERIIKFENAGIEIGYGKEEWGAEPNKLYFIIKHGKRL